MGIPPFKYRKAGSSDVGAIVGCSKYRSPEEMWSTWYNPPVIVETEHMKRGKEREDPILEKYNSLFKNRAFKTGPWQRLDFHERYAVNPDALILADLETGERGVVEIKSKVHKPKLVSYEHLIQMQYQMKFTEAKFADYVVESGYPDNIIYSIWRIDYSEEFWEWTYKRLKYFFDCVEKGEKPVYLNSIFSNPLEQALTVAYFKDSLKPPRCKFTKYKIK